MNKNLIYDLKDTVALLTGATGHLGVEMAKGLARAGATVILNARNNQKLLLLQEDIKREGGNAICFPCDITDFEKTKEGLESILHSQGALHIVVNNAHAGTTATLMQTTTSDFSKNYDLAVTSAFNIIQSTLPFLIKGAAGKRSGSIINIATMYATVSPDPRIYVNGEGNNPPFYGAAKAGLLQLTKYLACHLALQNIRVNAISPGPFPNSSLEIENPDFYKYLCYKNPMNRIGRPIEMVGPLLFLASSASTYVTGANIPVDGGWTVW